MTQKKSSTIMLTIVLAISAIALSACNQVPEEYKIKNFYGTYDKFADDTFLMWISHIEDDVEKSFALRWDVVSIDEEVLYTKNFRQTKSLKAHTIPFCWQKQNDWWRKLEHQLR